ncbi:glycoside hydrolase family 47 protein [Lentinula detonsa]|uniref:alpha-1,2-Mannosidase n=1 Tax=Lentinula detonsa TaxID=2804962 RepID=A0AA38Q7T2_9AGAR|nr:glycoside hydrolase family 47 protein [Lentinula detonsa]
MVKLLSPLKWAVVFCSCSYSYAGPVQVPGLQVPASAAANQEAVKDIFLQSYNAYSQFAFGHDSLLPVSKSFVDDRNGWGATIADALGTMSSSQDLFDQALDFVSKVDFRESNTPSSVSLFETTIRYVGGMISAYELSGKQHQILVQQAQQLVDKMVFSWVEPNQTIPFGEIFFSNNTPIVAVNNVAEAGTLDVEWSRVTLYTGNQTYTKLSEGSVRTIANLAHDLKTLGLPPQLVDPTDDMFVDAFLTWGGGTDSYLEYLIKYARITNTDDNLFADSWHAAVDSSIKILQRTSTVGDHIYLADWNAGEILLEGSHLACFQGGNWIFGGKLLNNQTIVDIGLELVDACWNTYASTETGIGPETFAFIAQDGTFSQPTAQELAFYQEHGFWITSTTLGPSDYIQRPEVLESNFYAWRATGDTKYLDRAASAITSFQKFLVAKETNGFAGLNDVNDFNAGLEDDTESFWFAEVLKYLYLTFDDPQNISLDNFVFNTEGQVFEAPPAKAVYGSGTPRSASGQFQTKTSDGLPLPVISPDPLVTIKPGPMNGQ